MPDGHKRNRRNGTKGKNRQSWYAAYRNYRFTNRFGFGVLTFAQFLDTIKAGGK